MACPRKLCPVRQSPPERPAWRGPAAPVLLVGALLAGGLLTAVTGCAKFDAALGQQEAVVQFRNGTTNTTFNFKQAGAALTGTMTGPQGDVEIKDGKVAGDTVSFKVALEFNGNSIVINFDGTVSGSEIKMKRMREGAPNATEFVLKKAS